MRRYSFQAKRTRQRGRLEVADFVKVFLHAAPAACPKTSAPASLLERVVYTRIGRKLQHAIMFGRIGGG